MVGGVGWGGVGVEVGRLWWCWGGVCSFGLTVDRLCGKVEGSGIWFVRWEGWCDVGPLNVSWVVPLSVPLIVPLIVPLNVPRNVPLNVPLKPPNKWTLKLLVVF